MTRARLVVALTALVLAAPASAATVASDVTANWGGYVVTPPVDPVTGLSGTFSTISGTWVQPTANCASASAGTSTASAFWVGLGGNSETSNALEQIGTEVDCSAAARPRYLAWYELVPALSKPIKLVVTPGDRINASVTVSGAQVTVVMRNLTRKTTFSRVLHMAAPDTTSAEWIAEAPSACTTSGTNCRQAPLTDFGTVRFSQSSLTDSNGHTGTISDPAWSPTALTLQSDIAGPTFDRYRTPVTPDLATPSALAAAGAGFTVKWSTETGATTDPGYAVGSAATGTAGSAPLRALRNFSRSQQQFRLHPPLRTRPIPDYCPACIEPERE